MSEIKIFKNVKELALNAAKHVAFIANHAIKTRGRFTMALSGGNTPYALYEVFTQPEYSEQIEWKKVYLFWSDERFVPHSHPESNYGIAKEAFLSQISIPTGNIFPVPTESTTVEAAAETYAQSIINLLGSTPCFDLILLGIGQDGHTASLFPNFPEVVHPSEKLVAPVIDSPKPPPVRITFTYKLINNAENVMFLVTGEHKAETVKKILTEPVNQNLFPAKGVNPVEGKLMWLLDRGAATFVS